MTNSETWGSVDIFIFESFLLDLLDVKNYLNDDKFNTKKKKCVENTNIPGVEK